jgi:hypothetical protein
MSRYPYAFFAFVLAALVASPSAFALNKQGLSVPLDTTERDGSESVPTLSGYVFGGALVYNPTYAARPDNTGLALWREGAHVDLDLYGKRLTVTYDANIFSDRESSSSFRPSEHDHIVGLVSRHGDFEVGAHYETDRPADRPGDVQQYVDVHTRVYYDLFRALPGLGRALPRQGFAGFFTLAGFAYNPTYAARPDLSGLALLRFVGHAEIDVYRPWLTFSVDLNFFTDRLAHHGAVPSELDTTIGLALHLKSFDVSIVAENDRPLDRAGLSQSYVSTLLTYRFDLKGMLAPRRTLPTTVAATKR